MFWYYLRMPSRANRVTEREADTSRMRSIRVVRNEQVNAVK